MNAEEFLERVRKIDLLLRNKRREYNRWMEAVDGGGGTSGERVQASRNLHRGSEAIGNYVDIEKEIQRLERERYGIIKTIAELPPDEYTVIYGIYVDGLSLKEIAYNERKSYEWVKSHRRKGINIIDKLINGGTR